MIQTITAVVRLRNPQFSIHKAVSSRLLLEFIFWQTGNFLRGLRLFILKPKAKAALLGKGVRFFNKKDIQIGQFVKLGDHVTLSALGTGGIILGNNVGIGDFSRVVVSTSLQDPGQFIRVGNQVGIGEFAYLGGGGGLTIGDDCIIGQYFSCHPENHHFSDGNTLIRHQGVSRKGIIIGNNCWIGSKVTILDGVEIGDGCVIAAGAVVTTSFPANSVIGGVPAKLLKKR